MNRYTTINGAAAERVAGESLIVTFLDEFIPEQACWRPVETVLPCEGTGYSVGAMSIVKVPRNLAEGEKFYDWALTAEAQTIRDQTKVIAIPSNRAAYAPSR